MRQSYRCAAPKCRGRWHYIDSLIGKAHRTFTALAADREGA